MTAVERKRDGERLDAIFCDALADGASIADAGKAIGCARSPANKRFARICREFGGQAV